MYSSKIKNEQTDGFFEAVLQLKNMEECYLSLIHI